jgi:hypothetical protein
MPHAGMGCAVGADDGGDGCDVPLLHLTSPANRPAPIALSVTVLGDFMESHGWHYLEVSLNPMSTNRIGFRKISFSSDHELCKKVP